MENKTPNNPELSDDLWKQAVADTDIRRTITQQSHLLFFHMYFQQYIKYETAQFHRDIFAITEDEDTKTAVIEAFRNSAKTTIVSLSYPIWAILGKQQRKFVIILAQTQHQARQYLTNIKQELESNALLKKDLGPFEEPDDEWRAVSIVIPKYDARITVASVDQPVRGLRHGPHRPDLIICDDLEDLNSVRNRDTRNKLYDWLMGDIIPLGDVNTRLMVIGTRLHEDSLMMRLRSMIQENKLNGIARSYPIVNENGDPIWPGKFPDRKSLDTFKKSVDDRAWHREYLLKIVGDTDQVIDLSWIKYYDHLPLTNNQYLFTITAVDLAISESERADYTAMITARVYYIKDEAYIFILPNPVNEKMAYPDIIERIKTIINMIHKSGGGYVVAEDVGFQKAFIHDVESFGANVIAFRPGAMDKRTRLSLTSGKVKTAHVLFPKKGAELIIDQIVHFGRGHDDLADAFSMLVIKTMEQTSRMPSITVFSTPYRGGRVKTLADDDT